MIKPLFVLFLILLIFISNDLFCQYDLTGLDLDGDVSEWFDNQLGRDNTPLVLGTYEPISRIPKTHPFYSKSNWIKGSIKYRGGIYRDVDMIYNISTDHVLIRHPTNQAIANQAISLDIGQIEWFDLNGSFFRIIDELVEKNGIYQILYDGKNLDFVAKRVKIIELHNTPPKMTYEAEDRFYILENNKLNAITSKRSFIKLYPELKIPIKKYIAEQRLKLGRTGTESDKLEMAKYSDQIQEK